MNNFFNNYGNQELEKERTFSSMNSDRDKLNNSNIIVFIDSTVGDYQNLVNGANPEAKVFVIDSTRDGVSQITQTLRQLSEIVEIHIISHGLPGSLQLGNTNLSLDTLAFYHQDLKIWSQALSSATSELTAFSSPSILLYGCNVAAGDAGAEFIEQLHQLTGANIAASINPTGSKALGGDWQLEVTTGKIEASPAFSASVTESYSFIFNLDFQKQIVDTTVDNTHSVVAADLDGDSDIDLVSTDFVDHEVVWYENDGSENFTKRLIDDDLEGAYPSNIGDVNGDGAIDVLAAGYKADTVVWYENDGSGNFTRRDVDTNADGAHSVVTGDIDLDGDIDLLTTNQDDATVIWYENDGNESFKKYIIDPKLKKAKYADFGDIDGDGDIDLFSAGFGGGGIIAWYENDGNQNFTKRVIDSSSDGAYFVFSVDLDKDGYLDVVSASKNINTIAWYKNNGNGEFTKQVITSNAIAARSVFAVDLDQDGYTDVLSASVDDSKVRWYRNDGNENFTEVVIDDSSDAPYGVFASDVNGDGVIDVLIASRDDNSVSLLLQNAPLSDSEQPIANDDSSIVAVANSVVIDVLSNDVDNDDTFNLDSLIVDTPPTEGTAQVNSDGTITYVHTGSTTGTDSFTYTFEDNDGNLSNLGTVNLTIGEESSNSILQSDDFNSSSLGSQWTFINPLEDGSFALTGAGTEDAYLELNVPSGRHDLWKNTQDAVRVMQTTANEDFEVEVKFDSEPFQTAQMQGILVEQDRDDWIRFDTLYKGSSAILFAAVTVDGFSTNTINVAVPTDSASYLRVNRQGDLWTFDYSSDGASWTTAGSFTQALEVTEVGPFAGNAGKLSPAFTAQVDYFFNTAAPIIPEDF